jgi:hypothetical protein
MTQTTEGPAKTPWIGIQMGSHTLYDEGIEHALDLLRDTCQLNALVVSAFGGGWRHGKGWPVVKRADHGAPIPNPPKHSPAAWVRTHESHYRGLRHRWPHEPDCDYGDCDILDDCAEPAAKRGIALYPRFFECRAEHSSIADDWDELDAELRPTGKRCVRNPDWNAHTHATVEDLVVHHPYISGVMYLQERHGPLSEVFEKNVGLDHIGHCFCEHCCRAGREAGINVERAKNGLRELTELAVAAKEDSQKPADGWFISFLRLLTRYPEIMAWEELWWDGLHRHREGIYRSVKRLRGDLRVGWHVHNPISFQPFYRAGMNFHRIREYSDWVKPNVYPGASGGRSRVTWVNSLMATLFKDVRPEIALNFIMDILGYDASQMPTPAQYLSGEKMPPWGPHYVQVETARAIAGFGEATAVYPGLGFDMPGHADDPASVHACTKAVFEAGAPGILLSREYEEMEIENLKAVGAAMREMGLISG